MFGMILFEILIGMIILFMCDCICIVVCLFRLWVRVSFGCMRSV